MIKVMHNETETLENAANTLMSLAQRAGAEAAEVCGGFGQRNKLALEKQDYHLASSDHGYQLGLRTTIGEQQGFASCNTLEKKDLREVAERALEITKFSPKNANQVIRASENVPTEAPRDPFDPQLHQLSLQTQKDWTKLMVDEATRDERFRLNEGTIEISSGIYLLLNSKGTHKVAKEASATWSLMGMAVEGDNITSFDYFTKLAHTREGIEDNILATTTYFRDYLIQSLRVGPAKSYKGLVVFSPRSVIDILLPALIYHLNGRSVVEKTSKWSLEDLHKQELDSQITLHDRPWLADRFGFATFDREGTPTKDRPIIENGTLRSLFLDNYSSEALGPASTGHASGGPSTLPAVSPHCLCMKGGSEMELDLLCRTTQQQEDFLVVHRFSGQTDPVTGDFSGVAKGADWWHAGERVYCAKETLISGNVFETLSSALFGISKETQVVDCSEESPTLVLDGVSVTAG